MSRESSMLHGSRFPNTNSDFLYTSYYFYKILPEKLCEEGLFVINISGVNATDLCSLIKDFL